MQIRAARSDLDLSGVMTLINALEREPVTLAQVQEWFQHNPPGRITHRRVAVNDQEQVIGYSVAVHETWAPPGRFYVWVGVAPEGRGQGTGAALYADALTFLQAHNATTLTSEVHDDDETALHFAQQRGFAVTGQQFSSVLDLATFDETPYQAELDAVAAAGIRFFTLAEVPDTPETRRAYYDLNRITTLDIPGVEGEYMALAEFEQRVWQGAWHAPAGQLIAAAGATWVGFAGVQLLPETQGAYNWMTGVLPAYRGHKIALALKIGAIRYARACGMKYISTDNDSRNAPMLALNRKLGYQPRPGTYGLRNNLEAPHG